MKEATKHTAPTHRKGDDACGCGCNPKTKACELICLERPHFFAGQLLADTELTALVTWAQQRLGLARYRTGWGIVHGLGLRAHPDQPGQVILETGYAVGCCGEDIVLCQELMIDIAKQCNLMGNACEDPAEQTDPSLRERQFDLFLQLAEVPSRLQPVLGQANCRSSTCQPSRVQETGQVRCKAVKPWSNGDQAGCPADAAQEKWQTGYNEVFGLVREFYKIFGTGTPNVKLAQDWLREELPGRPLRLFPKVAANIKAAYTSNWADIERWFINLLHDRMQAYLAGLAQAGTDCEPNQGVPLGRVWLERGPKNGDGWEVAYVDMQSPNTRRAVHGTLDSSDQIYIGDVMLQVPDVARRMLRQRGLEIVKAFPTMSASEFLRQWGQATNAPLLFTKAGSAMTLQVIYDTSLDPRVMACMPSEAQEE